MTFCTWSLELLIQKVSSNVLPQGRLGLMKNADQMYFLLSKNMFETLFRIEDSRKIRFHFYERLKETQSLMAE